MTQGIHAAAGAVAHLNPQVWAKVNRHVIVKAIGELAHELLLAPRRLRTEGDWHHYVLNAPGGRIEYHFRAHNSKLDHWHIEPTSLRKFDAGIEAPLDALHFITELRDILNVPADVLPEYLHELASTLSGAAYKDAHCQQSASTLARADFQDIETAMTEGHPIFIANNGRLGFNAQDYPLYAPEAASRVALVWLAALESHADVACVGDLSYPQLIREELDVALYERLAGVLRARGLDPERYLLIPVHPWQWQNRIVQLFAPDLARGHLIYLGTGEADYLAQQSIRTFFNVREPHKRYVKTALSIVNMGFTRGLSAALGASAAAVNDWVGKLVTGDEFFRHCAFSILREVAFVGFRQRYYEAAITRRSEPYKEMLAALWRESPLQRLMPGQRLMTMAALLHIDREGQALLPELIRASSLGPDAWLRRYLHHYLEPLVHAFYAHNFVFTPHCENTLLVLENDAVVGVLLKDIAEDVGVLNPESPLPDNVRHLALRVPEEVMTLAIFTDVFDCVFRFLAPLLRDQMDYSEERFWELVAECINDYQRRHPRLAAKFARYDLFAPRFIRNCLNRLQLRNNREMVDINAPDPVDSLQFSGFLDNPIAVYREAAPRAQKGAPRRA